MGGELQKANPPRSTPGPLLAARVTVGSQPYSGAQKNEKKEKKKNTGLCELINKQSI